MDLSVIADLLDDFATFAGSIKEFLTLPVTLLSDLSSLDAEAQVGITSANLEGLSSVAE